MHYYNYARKFLYCINIILKPKREETESDDDNQALDVIGYNADLYICIFLIKWLSKINLLD